MEALKIGSRREVCWDEALMDKSEGVRVQMHKPEYRNDALVCDKPWEGNVCGYFTVIPDGQHFRLYYRGASIDVDEFGKETANQPGVLCYAQSDDGKTFQRINAGIHPFWGTKDNNILSLTTGDNISFFKDTNPDCPKEELFKGLCGGDIGEGEDRHACLWLYTSADGVHFEKTRVLADDGAYDSLNICFWDAQTQQYYLFYRGFHGEGTDGNRPDGWFANTNTEEMDEDEKLAIEKHCKGLIRDVRMRTSRDFSTWSEPMV